jgi:uncharacterized protein (DUF2384 family)
MLPINLWGENWRHKLSEMSRMSEMSGMNEMRGNNEMSGKNKAVSDMETQGEMSEDEKETEFVDNSSNVAGAKPTSHHKKKPAMTDKYMERLRMFSRNPLARTLRAPEVWEEAVNVWTNQFEKRRFCVVMVRLQLITFWSMC